MKRILAIAALVANLPLAAYAADGFYVGAGLTLSNVESSTYIDSGCTPDQNVSNGCPAFKDTGSSGYRIFGGVQLTKSVALEVGYADPGTFKSSYTYDCDGTCFVEDKLEPTVFDVVAVGSVPLFSSVSLFGKAGVAFLNMKRQELDTGYSSVPTKFQTIKSEDLTFGGGVDIKAGPVKVRVDANWINAEDTDKFRVLGVSLIYPFGK
jgi:opacity protein-like surface antigen